MLHKNLSLLLAFVFLILPEQIASTRNIRLDGFTNRTRSTKPYDHRVFSGRVTLLNAKQMEILNFNYDGAGPYAYWSIKLRSGNTVGSEPNEFGDYRSNPIVEDWKNSQNSKKRCERPRLYKNERVVLSLPPKYRWSDVEWIGMYCYRFKHLFNYMPIPNSDQIKKLDQWSGLAMDCNKVFGLCGSNGKPKHCYTKCNDGRDCAKDLLR